MAARPRTRTPVNVNSLASSNSSSNDRADADARTSARATTRPRPARAAAALAAAVAGVLAATVSAAPAAPAAPATNRLDGTWQTDGYGMVITIEDGQLTVYDRTRADCLPDQLSAAQLAAPGRNGTTRYGSGGVPLLTVTPQGRQHAIARSDGSVGHIRLDRLAALPALCAAPPPTTPLTVFDDFWASFAENYPFFTAKGIDWQALRDRYRPLIGPGTTDAQLGQIMTDMLAPLHDAHTALAYQGGTVYSGLRSGTRSQTPQLRAQAQAAVDAQLVGPEQTWAQGKVGVGELPGRIGYLRIWSFDDYVDGGGYQQQAAVLDQALDALLSTANTTGPDALRGLVIDVRLNAGGSDALGLRVASRLTDQAYTAYRKRARNDPDDATRFTRPEPITVDPAATPRWTGPVALLTSSYTGSAGETFTQALMGRGPQVTRIGDNTQGVFSDVLLRTLSADWLTALPNEEYLDARGHTFDGAGIPPDLRTPVFTAPELAARQDSALSAARRLLDPTGRH
ncbi:S41 family peptidase [Kitasatospora sp. NBC_01287]|uniref:S41 family peptidase n=1 Tax=Kitasatospora sp. NBC_01287 TaxID=2903573 RepID=UPI002252C2FC|nr:S41 family peptidase [Kitasatospora sp. NBC_01287]MCX4751075.1 S41 family peptidase [Kitasatospora sp. NBC_01287]